jgi:glucose-1-phosphate thymidylyltransferase
MKCIILAGGFATRLWPLTEKTAKPLILLAGKPIISWIVEALPSKLEITVSTNAVFAADFQEWKKTFPERSIDIFVEDSDSEEGKKGALYATSLVIQKKNIREDILLIAGDNYFGFSLRKFLENFFSNPRHPLLAAYDIKKEEHAKMFGVIVPKNDSEVAHFQEKPKKPLSTLVSTGCFAFPERLLGQLCQFAHTSRDDLGKVFEYFLEEGEVVRYASFEENWFDVGSFASYLEANKHLLRGSFFQEENVSLGSDTQVSGSVFLGKNVHVLKNVIIENSIVLEGTILENCKIRDSVIGKNVFIADIDLENKIVRDESFLMR